MNPTGPTSFSSPLAQGSVTGVVTSINRPDNSVQVRIEGYQDDGVPFGMGWIFFIGAVGLSHVRFEADFTPAVEIAWRLHRRHWGQGYATEAARAAIEDGFSRAGLREIVALTALGNIPSQRVMERLGMTRTLVFDHPNVPADSPLRQHVLYRLARPAQAPGSPTSTRG